ncbi:MAG: ABC transporter ATP-binding protein [Chloroflexota bacterium]|nr:ABC transporter ATP-binding protein [Chloroflexota bacterium]
MKGATVEVVELELRDVMLGYGPRVILKDISFEVRKGELVGLVGPNGSGKSTLIKGITRLIPLQSGQILIRGQQLLGMSRSSLARSIAVVPQSPVLPELFTSFEVVLMGRTPHLKFLQRESKKDVGIAWRAMQKTQTDHLADRRVSQLSGGERQRLTIARALTQEAELLLLDEPTSHLDLKYQVESLDLVKELCMDKGMAALAAMHDLNLAAQYCDRLVMLEHKGIHSQGTLEEVITPDAIRKVYGAEVMVFPHPVNRLPTTVIMPRHTNNGGSEEKRD